MAWYLIKHSRATVLGERKDMDSDADTELIPEAGKDKESNLPNFNLDRTESKQA
jgi:hypothetical protein